MGVNLSFYLKMSHFNYVTCDLVEELEFWNSQ